MKHTSLCCVYQQSGLTFNISLFCVFFSLCPERIQILSQWLFFQTWIPCNKLYLTQKTSFLAPKAMLREKFWCHFGLWRCKSLNKCSTFGHPFFLSSLKKNFLLNIQPSELWCNSLKLYHQYNIFSVILWQMLTWQNDTDDWMTGLTHHNQIPSHTWKIIQNSNKIRERWNRNQRPLLWSFSVKLMWESF